MRIVKRSCYDEEGNLLIKPYRVMDLAALYDVTTKTMRKWIATAVPDIQKSSGHYYSAKAVAQIIQAIGAPQKLSIKNAA